MMGGSGFMDHMIKSFRNNRGLLNGSKKSLKTIFEENDLHYIKKRVEEKTRKYDPETKRIFLEKFHVRQRRIRKRLTMILITVVIVCLAVSILLYNAVQ